MSSITKSRYLGALQQQVNKIAQVMETSQPFLDLYSGRGYDLNHSGADPIVDADVAGIGITANQVYSAEQVLGQLAAFFTPANRAIINAVRNDK